MSQIPASLLLNPDSLDELSCEVRTPDAAVLSDWLKEHEPLQHYGADNLPHNFRAWLAYHTIREIVKYKPGFFLTQVGTFLPEPEICHLIDWCHGDQSLRKIQALRLIHIEDNPRFAFNYAACLRNLAGIAADPHPMKCANAALGRSAGPPNESAYFRFEQRVSVLHYVALHLPPLPHIDNWLGSHTPQ